MIIEEYQKMYELEEKHWWFKGKRKIVFNWLVDLQHQHKILDVGCGTGINLIYLKRRANFVIGIDSSKEAIDFCKLRGHKTLCQADILSLPLKDNSIDIILALDVLEHIDNDELAISELHRVLKPKGKLFITVPAFKFLWSKHDEIHHHYRRYTKIELVNKIKKYNFSIPKSSYTNMFIFPIVFAVRGYKNVIVKLRKDNTYQYSSDLVEVGYLINQILTYLYTIEAKILKIINLPFGTSLFCICVKEEGYRVC